jgi:hypothetical protein
MRGAPSGSVDAITHWVRVDDQTYFSSEGTWKSEGLFPLTTYAKSVAPSVGWSAGLARPPWLEVSLYGDVVDVDPAAVPAGLVG